MTTFALALDLRDDPELIARYRARHQAVPAAVEARLLGAGVERLDIYGTGNRLFMVLELPDGADPGTAFAGLNDDPAYAAWDAEMRELQVPVPSARPGELWSSMEHLYRLEGGR
jgi:L-rhamnose mutarotase